MLKTLPPTFLTDNQVMILNLKGVTPPPPPPPPPPLRALFRLFCPIVKCDFEL